MRNSLALIVGFSLFISEGINYSLLAPFFPNEAELDKGLDEFQVGVINSSFDMAVIVFTLTLAVGASPELNKFFFLWGGVVGAAGLICFGVLSMGPGGFTC